MRVHYSVLFAAIAGAAVAGACGESNPVATQGTNTPYHLSFDSVTPNPINVRTAACKCKDSVKTFKIWVSDVDTKMVVPNAAPAVNVVITNTKIASYKKPTSGSLTTSVRGLTAGSTQVTMSYVNANTGQTLSVPAPVPIIVTP